MLQPLVGEDISSHWKPKPTRLNQLNFVLYSTSKFWEAIIRRDSKSKTLSHWFQNSLQHCQTQIRTLLPIHWAVGKKNKRKQVYIFYMQYVHSGFHIYKKNFHIFFKRNSWIICPVNKLISIICVLDHLTHQIYSLRPQNLGSWTEMAFSFIP